MTALSLLCRPGERLDAETVLALILTEFERLWNAFLAGQGSWAPFEEAYLDAWMHSYVFRPLAPCFCLRVPIANEFHLFRPFHTATNS